MFVFEMPEIGEGVVEGEVVEWKVAIGDRVEVDQPLCDVMTDKANVEISSPRAGTIAKLYGNPGDIISVHTPLVEIDENGAEAPLPSMPVSVGKASAESAPAPVAEDRPSVDGHGGPSSLGQGPSSAPPVPARSPGPTKAPPAVRRHANEDGIDIHAVTGTGRGGRVTHADLDAFKKGGVPVARPRTPIQATGTETREKVIGLRRRIATAMQTAVTTAAHFTYVEELDCENLVTVRNLLKPVAAERGIHLSFIPLVMKACSLSFRDFPRINAWMDDAAGEFVIKGDHHIGFACDTPNGLMVPVIRNVEQKSILRIAQEMNELIERAKVGKATREELSGSTFSITGVGNMGVLATPILNLPEVGILGFNAIRDEVVFHEGEIQVRKRNMLSGSFDHRVVDGLEAAKWTARLKEILENPGILLTEVDG